jgi:hypothetical protein
MYVGIKDHKSGQREALLVPVTARLIFRKYSGIPTEILVYMGTPKHIFVEVFIFFIYLSSTKTNNDTQYIIYLPCNYDVHAKLAILVPERNSTNAIFSFVLI